MKLLHDSQGNRIPDFSFAGYKNGEAQIPNIPVVKVLEPISGDITVQIQKALDEISQLK